MDHHLGPNESLNPIASSQRTRNPPSKISSTTIYDVSLGYLVPLCACNLLIMLGSAAVLLGSVYALFSGDEMEPSYTGPRSFLVSVIFNFEVVLLVTSLLFFLTASVGLLGGLRENTCLLKTFSTTMMVLSCLGAFVGIFVAFLPWLTRNFFLSHVTDDFVVHYRDKADYKNTIDFLQSNFHCCGMSEAGYRDWQANIYFACNKTSPSAEKCSVPPSCCRRTLLPPEDGHADQSMEVSIEVPSHFCGHGVLSMNESDAWKVIYLRGCGDAVFQKMRAHNFEILVVILLLVLCGILLATLADSVRRQIKALASIYDEYYKTVYRGQASMRRVYERARSPTDAQQIGAAIPSPRLASKMETRRM